MTEKNYTIVGISTQHKITKFRVANGDIVARIKVLERNGHTDVKLIELPVAMDKMAAIAEFKAQNPDATEVRMPNHKEAKAVKTKTITVKKAKGKTVTDAAIELLKEVEGA